jgi:hypothetical protein
MSELRAKQKKNGLEMRTESHTQEYISFKVKRN